MSVRTQIRSGAYFDSVKLMLVTKSLRSEPGVRELSVVMGTALNKENLAAVGLLTPQASAATQTDLIIAVDAEDEDALDHVLARVEEELSAGVSQSAGEVRARTVAAAMRQQPESTILVVSVPGQHARPLVEDAIDQGLNVMLFSDNMSLEDEVAVKLKAEDRGVLVMGTDCGTAMVNGVPLCFCNNVRRGPVGLVSASGTGSQEVMTLIHRLGSGISQALGTGGRDLRSEVGGLSFMQALRALDSDEETKVIVLVSKPPSPDVAEKVFEYLRHQVTKPVVVSFIASTEHPDLGDRVVVADSLEDCAMKAVQAATGAAVDGLWSEDSFGAALAALRAMPRASSAIRGLYAGGTLAYEAQHILRSAGIDIRSNLGGGQRVDETAEGSFIIDFGDDAYTTGRAHPMIDSTLRASAFATHYADPQTGVILLDFVLGYGADLTPERDFVEVMRTHPGGAPVIATVCGIAQDPQNYDAVVRELQSVGVVVAPSNRIAATLAAALADKEVSL